MATIRFKQSVFIDDAAACRVKVDTGTTISESDILPGCLVSCLATGIAERIEKSPAMDEQPVKPKRKASAAVREE